MGRGKTKVEDCSPAMSRYAERSRQGLTELEQSETRDRVIVALHRPSPQAKPVEGIVRIAENVTADFYGPGDAEALAVKCRADAGEAGFDPDQIGAISSKQPGARSVPEDQDSARRISYTGWKVPPIF